MIQHKKTIISFAIVGIILCASLMVSGCTDYETYTNDDYGFSLQYPETWNIKEESMGDGMIISFTNPEDETQVLLAAVDLSGYSDMNLEDYVEEIVFSTISAVEGVDINKEHTTINEQEAYEVTASFLDDDGEEHQMKEIIFLDKSLAEGNKGYVLAYDAKSYAYKANLKTADKIMKSFSFDTN